MVQPAAVGESDRSEHRLHRPIVRQRLGNQPAKARRLGDHRQILEQDGGDALVVAGVGYGEGDLGVVPSIAGVVLPDTDEGAVGLGDEGDVDVDVDVGHPGQLLVGDRRSLAEEPQVPGGRIKLFVERSEGRDIGRSCRPDADRPASRQQDVAFEGGEQ